MSDQTLAERFKLSKYLVERPEDYSDNMNNAQHIRIASHIEIHERISGDIKFFTSENVDVTCFYGSMFKTIMCAPKYKSEFMKERINHFKFQIEKILSDFVHDSIYYTSILVYCANILKSLAYSSNPNDCININDLKIDEYSVNYVCEKYYALYEKNPFEIFEAICGERGVDISSIDQNDFVCKSAKLCAEKLEDAYMIYRYIMENDVSHVYVSCKRRIIYV